MRRTIDDFRVVTLWDALFQLRDELLPEGDELYDAIWLDICQCMESIEEDLARLKGLEK